ncbi:MAG: TIGR03618 family F420-dependent PPOX class oxidoreductase [Acidimicrobiales bacterium]
MVLNDAAQAALNSHKLAQLTTINPDGSTQVSVVWVKAEGDDVLLGHLGAGQKVRNLRRDPRATVTILTGERNQIGLDEYLVVHGLATVTDGGAPELLQELAHGYLGPDVRFPPMPDPPPGVVVRITANRVGGVGPWTD